MTVGGELRQYAWCNSPESVEISSLVHQDLMSEITFWGKNAPCVKSKKNQ